MSRTFQIGQLQGWLDLTPQVRQLLTQADQLLEHVVIVQVSAGQVGPCIQPCAEHHLARHLWIGCHQRSHEAAFAPARNQHRLIKIAVAQHRRDRPEGFGVMR
nr:hypothetical protein [Desulfobacula sp.]